MKTNLIMKIVFFTFLTILTFAHDDKLIFQQSPTKAQIEEQMRLHVNDDDFVERYEAENREDSACRVVSLREKVIENIRVS